LVGEVGKRQITTDHKLTWKRSHQAQDSLLFCNCKGQEN